MCVQPVNKVFLFEIFYYYFFFCDIFVSFSFVVPCEIMPFTNFTVPFEMFLTFYRFSLHSFLLSLFIFKIFVCFFFSIWFNKLNCNRLDLFFFFYDCILSNRVTIYFCEKSYFYTQLSIVYIFFFI